MRVSSIRAGRRREARVRAAPPLANPLIRGQLDDLDPNPQLPSLRRASSTSPAAASSDAAHDAAIGVLQDRVAARDGRQRADRLQRARQATQAHRVAARRRAMASAAAMRPQASRALQARQPSLRMRRAQHRIGMAQAGAVAVQPSLPGGSEPRRPSAALRAAVAGAPVDAAHAGATPRDRRAASPRAGAGAAGCAARASSARRRREQVVLAGHQQFRRGRWRRRAQVGGEVGEAEIGFMADRGDDRHRRGGDRAHQMLVVERPQVLERAAAAGQQQHVVAAAGRCAPQHRRDLRRRASRPAPAPAGCRPAATDSVAPARSARRAPRRRWAK